MRTKKDGLHTTLMPTAASLFAARSRGERTAIVLLAVASLLLLVESAAPQPQLDDSFISYRYARNLVAGNGLVWNPGEHVEGITNLLWTLSIAAGIQLGFDAPLVGHVLGIASGVGLLVGVFALASVGVAPRVRWIAALAPLVVLASPAIPYQATNGMETLLFVALAVGALAAHASRRRVLTTVLLALGILNRPDAVIVGAIVLGCQLLEDGPTRARSWLPSLTVGLVGLAITAFRLAYYGSPVPNTFYAKVGGVPFEMSLEMAVSYLCEAPVFVAPAALVLLRRDASARAPLLLCVATLAYVLTVGQGGLTFSRFLMPIFPVLVALSARKAARASDAAEPLAAFWLSSLVGCAAAYVAGTLFGMGALGMGAVLSTPALRTLTRRRVVLVLTASVVGVVAMTLVVTPNWRNVRVANKRLFDAGLAARARATARQLETRLAPGSTVASLAIGVIGYETHFPILDLLGLTDAVIARNTDTVRGRVVIGPGHMRSNANYVMDQRPEVIRIGRDSGSEVQTFVAVHALWEHPEFHNTYVWDRQLDAYRLRGRRIRLRALP